MPDAIVVDASRMTGLFDRLQANADRVPAAVERAGHRMAATVSGIPVRTGALAGSLHVKRVGEASALILSDVVYASYVFMGTKHVAARPPQFAYGQEQFARDVAAELFQ